MRRRLQHLRRRPKCRAAHSQLSEDPLLHQRIVLAVRCNLDDVRERIVAGIAIGESQAGLLAEPGTISANVAGFAEVRPRTAPGSSFPGRPDRWLSSCQIM